MTRAVAIACAVAALLMVAWMVGPSEYEVPREVNQERTVTPMTDEEVWGS